MTWGQMKMICGQTGCQESPPPENRPLLFRLSPGRYSVHFFKYFRLSSYFLYYFLLNIFNYYVIFYKKSLYKQPEVLSKETVGQGGVNMRIVHRLLLVLLIGIFLFGCSGKKSGVEGKIVDGQGQPITGVKIIIKQVQPVKGYEQFETITGTDGIFRFDGVMPTSEYIITPFSDRGKTKVTMKVTSGTLGQTLVLNNPMIIRFQAMKDGSVIDTKTGLQWLIYAGTDLSFDSVLNTVKNIKEGGFSDWRLPTKAELVSLASSSRFQTEMDTAREACCAWTEEPNSEKIDWDFYVDDGNDLWASSKIPANNRIVVVRTAGGVASVARAPSAPAPAAMAAPGPAAPPATASPAPATPAAEKKETPAKEPSTKKEAVAPPAPKKEIAKKAPIKGTTPPKTAPAEKNDVAQIGNNVVVHFAMNKSAIVPEDLVKIKAFYAKVKSSPGKIVIEGHADSLGNSSEKLKISVDRALKVLDMFKKMGLSDKVKVELKGMGDAKAAAENDSEEGRKLNRRVELSFIPE
jgi:outer membrane protein OmpA-like peptidoglycan-associated protein